MLIDDFGRKFKYLRISITDKCNFRCSYCLPNGYLKNINGCENKSFLNLDEIVNLATAFKELGVEKIRLTGGEPSLRQDLISIVHALKIEVGVSELAITTNGYRLDSISEQLRKAGLDAINISLDSLQPERFRTICGLDKGMSLLQSIDKCVALGFRKIKVNCVLLKGVNDDELSAFLEYVETRPITVRFIELMRTGDNKEYFERHHISVSSIMDKLNELGWKIKFRSDLAGPAIEYESQASLGKIGVISPYGKDFCLTCNRLRVSALGNLRLCLFGQGDLPLRSLLQKKSDKNRLKEKIISSLQLKREGHKLYENQFGKAYSLSEIGG